MVSRLQISDERPGVQGLSQGRVVNVAVRLEVAREVVFGIAPPVRPDGDLAAANRVPERSQDAQLVGDPLKTAGLINHCCAPVPRDHAVDRGSLRGRVEAVLAGPIAVAREELQGVHHGPVGGVRAAKLERAEQARQHPAIVRGIRGAKHRPHALAKRLIVCFRHLDQVAQRALPDDGEHRRADCLVGMLDRSFGEAKQDPLLPADAAQVADQLSLDEVLGAGADPVNELDQQIHEPVGDLRGPRPARRSAQRPSSRSTATGESRAMVRVVKSDSCPAHAAPRTLVIRELPRDSICSLRQRRSNAVRTRSSLSSTGQTSPRSHSVQRSSSATVDSRNPNAS